MNTRIFGVEVLDGLRGIWREPAALFFSIAMPVAFFVLFVSIFGQESSGVLPAGTIMVANFGTFGVLLVTLLNPGIGVADDRERGWLRAKRVSAVPIGITLAAKVAAALPYAVAVLVAMAVAAAINGSLEASASALLRVFVVLVFGSLPFALFGLAVGFQASANASTAILNAVLLPSAVMSGLWMPLEILPDVIGRIAVFLPTYHLAQLGLAQLQGGPVLTHVLVLAGTTLATAMLAAISYRHTR